MKIIILLLVYLVASKAHSQSQYLLSTNNLKANIDYSGVLFNDNSFLYSGLRESNDKLLIFQATPWILGQKNNTIGGLTMESSTYKYGPVTDPLYYNANVANWQRVWHITKAEIDFHIQNFNQPSYTIPNAILEWPAHGNTQIGQAQNLAEFYDANGDGIYNPSLGDYPIIRGDEAVFYILNDGYNFSNNQIGLGMELHVMVYAYNCSDFSVLNNSLFVHYRVINRSSSVINEMYFGMFSDFDLGASEDDFVGSHAKYGATYAYNGDGFDEDANGYYGFGAYPGMIATSILAGAYLENDGMDNPVSSDYNEVDSLNGISYVGLGKGYGDGIIDNERMGARFAHGFFRIDQSPTPGLSIPYAVGEKYYSLKGYWSDGTPLYYGGTGHVSSPEVATNGYIPCRFALTGNSDPYNYSTYGIPPMVNNWTQVNNGDTPSDRKAMVSTGPSNLLPNTYQDFDIAFVYTNNTIANDPLGGFGALQNRLQGVHQYFELNATPCGQQMVGINEINNDNVEMDIYPNPNNGEFFIKTNSLAFDEIAITDISGKLIEKLKMNNASSSVTLPNVESGIYFISLLSNHTILATKKLVISK